LRNAIKLQARQVPAGYHEKPLSAAKMETKPDNHGQSAAAGEARDQQRKHVQQVVHADEDTRRAISVKLGRSQTVVVTTSLTGLDGPTTLLWIGRTAPETGLPRHAGADR